LYHLKNQNEETYKYYKKVSKNKSKGESPVLNNWAWYIATSDKNGNLNKALRNEQEDHRYLNPTIQLIWIHTGGYFTLQGNYPEARKQFQHAMAYGGTVTIP
jgi:hypothetical protein